MFEIGVTAGGARIDAEMGAEMGWWGWERDEWPAILEQAMTADILSTRPEHR
jgi:hypothetical protein